MYTFLRRDSQRIRTRPLRVILKKRYPSTSIPYIHTCLVGCRLSGTESLQTGVTHGLPEHPSHRHPHLRQRACLQRLHHLPHPGRRTAHRHERSRGQPLGRPGRLSQQAAARRPGLWHLGRARRRGGLSGPARSAAGRLGWQHRLEVGPHRARGRRGQGPCLAGAPAPRLPARGVARGLLRPRSGTAHGRRQYHHPHAREQLSPRNQRQAPDRRQGHRGHLGRRGRLGVARGRPL